MVTWSECSQAARWRCYIKQKVLTPSDHDDMALAHDGRPYGTR